MPEILCYDLVLHDISRAIVDNDISIFFEQNLGIIRRECALPADWPGKQMITYLVQSAGGLFIWAATAYRFVRDGRQFTKDRLSRILKGDLAVNGPEAFLSSYLRKRPDTYKTRRKYTRQVYNRFQTTHRNDHVRCV
jgi:hypothetical protein